MTANPIPAAYARSLLELAQAENALRPVQEELLRLRDLVRSNPDLLRFLKDPNIRPEGKRQALAELLGGRMHPLVLNFLFTLSDQNRVGSLGEILDAFRAAAEASQQQVNGELTTAVPLDDATLARLGAELNRVTGKSVQLFPRIDPSILGGAIIKVGEQIIDASLRRKLDNIRTALTQ